MLRSQTHRPRNHPCKLCCDFVVTPWKLETESEAPSTTSFRSGWHYLIKLLELINEKMHIKDGQEKTTNILERVWGYYDHRPRRPDRNFREKSTRNFSAVLVLFFSCTVLSTILEPEPEPIAVAEDSSSGSSSCTIAVTAKKWERRHHGSRLRTRQCDAG